MAITDAPISAMFKGRILFLFSLSPICDRIEQQMARKKRIPYSSVGWTISIFRIVDS